MSNRILWINQGTGFCTGSDDSSIILHDIRADQSLAVYEHEDLRHSLYIRTGRPLALTVPIDKILSVKNERAWVSIVSYLKN